MRDLRREDRERNDGRTSVELETALALIAHDVAPIVETEQVPPAEGLGRVLSEDVRMEGDLPPFDRSPLDGYALRSADTQGAAPLRTRFTPGAWGISRSSPARPCV